MKILWISNVCFSLQKFKQTGTWLFPLAQKLNDETNIEIINLAVSAKGNFHESYIGSIKQYNIPFYKKITKDNINNLNKLIDDINPDLIHLWGTENNYGNYLIDYQAQRKVLLDMQGLIFSVRKWYFGDLSFLSLLKNIALKDILRFRSSLLTKKHTLAKTENGEQNIIKKMNYISVQSEWVKNYVRFNNSNCKIFRTEVMLREEFYRSPKWFFKEKVSEKIIFAVSSCDYPLKGGHILIKAFALLKKKHPNLKLKIVDLMKKGIRKSSYDNFIRRLVKKEKLNCSIEWLHTMDAEGLVEGLFNSSVFVNPSFVESYSMTIAEALSLGVPCVASFAGAMPEFSFEKETLLYFPPGDVISCASQIEKALFNKEIALKLSNSAVKFKGIHNNADKIVMNQIRIYNEIIS
ncbi:MAG: glycosyltransferase [Bacteroidetes bacterium]|nr:glycosyltransferase [Bacteroidota bacterium]